MTIAEGLDRLRAAHGGCEAVAFGDLGTRLVLRSSSDIDRPQEFYDRLCVQAARLFGLSDGAARRSGSQPGSEIVVLTEKDSRVFVRSTENRSDFVACVGGDDMSTAAVAGAAAGVLAEAAAS